jgi:hypothetical protein
MQQVKKRAIRLKKYSSYLQTPVTLLSGCCCEFEPPVIYVMHVAVRELKIVVRRTLKLIRE